MKTEAFVDLLACPETGDALYPAVDGSCLTTASGRSYEIRNGVPILLTEADAKQFESVLTSTGKAMAEEYASLREQAPVCQPVPERPFPPHNLPTELIDEAYLSKDENTRILSVGGGPTRNSPNEINLNMGLFPEVDVVGNALRLPFRTDSVDGVWCNAVLEHIADFNTAIAEMIRVTEPGGLIMVQVPFLQAMHGYPGDYQRFTVEGLAHQMRDLEIVAKGEAVGASFTIWQLLKLYFDGPGQRTLPRWVRGLTRRTLLPALVRSSMDKTDWQLDESEKVLSSLVYCFGRKRSS